MRVRCANDSPDTHDKPRDRTDSTNSTIDKQRRSVSSVASSETNFTTEGARKGSGVRLPPLSHEKGGRSWVNPPSSERLGSGDSVTSTRKVDVDVGRSPRTGGRVTAKVGDLSGS